MRKIKLKSSAMSHTASALGFAIIALLFALADLINYVQLGERFTPFSVAYPVSALTYDETQVYVPGARRFFETNSLKMEVDVFELRKAVGIWPVAHSIVIGSIAKLVGSLDEAWVIAHAVFPASVWLLFFFIARKLQLPVASALALASATCLIPFGLRNFFLVGQDAFIQPLELSRLPHPGLSLALLLLGIMAVSRAVTAGSIVVGVGAGILIGVNFYSYYFYWMAAGLGLCTWLGAAVILERWSEVRVLLVAGLTALVIGSPFLTNLALAWQSQGATNLMERGGYFGRELSLTELTLALMLIGTAIFLYTRAQVPPLTIALVFAATGAALGLNAHLLTGYNANDFHHFVKMLIQPLVFFLCGAAVIKWLPWCRIGTLCMLATVVLLGLGVYRQVRVADTITQSHDRTASPIQLVETLRSRVAAGSVIGSSDPQVITLLPALSTLWTFVPLGIRSEASNNEILRRYLIVRKLEGATILDVHADFNRMFPTTRMDRFLSYVLFQNFEGALAQLHPRIDQVWSELDLVKDLSARRLDILATVGMPPPLPESTGWQLVMIDPIGKWNIFHLQSLKAASR